MVSAVSRCAVAFATPKIDNSRHRYAVDLTHQDVGRFQIAMQDGFLMRVLNSLAYTDEQFQPLARGELVLVAIGGDGNASDVLHDEVRPAFRCRAGIEYL